MSWGIRKDPEGWKCKMPVFKFKHGNGVTTRMGTEDTEGKLRIFLITLDDTQGILACHEEVK